ncbi:MAG TPA: YdeI/OmpD-associated family protein [Caulifigura sp.]|nr:YdeI/OmpD-associated family protein [Caulifigura sp.]
MSSRLPEVDAYIDKSADFAQPVLIHIREQVHAACPDAEEALKWGMPSFLYQGKILCGMAAFKAHCTFGFWHSEMNKTADPKKAGGAMGQMGRVTCLKDLPRPAEFKKLVKQAMKLIDDGVKSTMKREKKPPLKVPADLTTALAKNARAKANFAAFSPSHQREYVEWISEAKRPATRQKRLATTLEWLAQGKARNWKYENC